jgi:hypothetical protein
MNRISGASDSIVPGPIERLAVRDATIVMVELKR